MMKRTLLSVFITIFFLAAAGCGSHDFSAWQAGPEEREDFQLPEESHYEVVVVGGEPEGIAAALASARSGKKTLLVEEGPALGGLWTLGRLNFFDMNYGPDGELLTQGIFEEFYQALGNGFDIEEAIDYFRGITEKEPLLDVALNTKVSRPNLETADGGQVLVNLETAEGQQIYGSRFIDATTDADLAAASGVPYTLGGEDYGRPQENQAATLVFQVKNVDWYKVFLYNNWQRVLSKLKAGWGDPYAGANFNLAWGYGREALNFQPWDDQIRFRGPNMARQKNGQVLLNALLIFGVDPLDEGSKAAGIQRGQAELPNIIDFMQKNFVGFEQAELVDTAPRLYIRESRHIQGEYRLTITDVLENRDHWDRVALGSYPVDIQPVSPDSLGDVIGKPAMYSIPFRCLVPLNVNNLLVVGRSASYDSLAHGSARVVPIGVACGEAAGVASALSLDQDVDFRELSRDENLIAKLQEELIRRGAYLKEFAPIPIKETEHWAYKGLVVMRELGLAAGGYSNDYGLDKTAEYWDVQRILSRVQSRIMQLVPEANLAEISFEERPLSRADMLQLAAEMLRFKQNDPAVTPAELLIREGIISREIIEKMEPLTEKPTFGELYWLGARIYSNYVKY